MEREDLTQAEVFPVGEMFTCTRESIAGTSLTLPENVQNSKAFTVLIVDKVGNTCVYVKKGDLVLQKPLPKKYGSVELFGEEYIMCSENEVGIIIRRTVNENQV